MTDARFSDSETSVTGCFLAGVGTAPLSSCHYETLRSDPRHACYEPRLGLDGSRSDSVDDGSASDRPGVFGRYLRIGPGRWKCVLGWRIPIVSVESAARGSGSRSLARRQPSPGIAWVCLRQADRQCKHPRADYRFAGDGSSRTGRSDSSSTASTIGSAASRRSSISGDTSREIRKWPFLNPANSCIGRTVAVTLRRDGLGGIASVRAPHTSCPLGSCPHSFLTRSVRK